MYIGVILYCGHLIICDYFIWIYRTNERKSAGGVVTAQSTAEDPPEDGRKKRPKHVGVLYSQTRF